MTAVRAIIPSCMARKMLIVAAVERQLLDIFN
jgi:hypothetical protein